MQSAGFRILASGLRSNSVASALNGLHNLRHILLASVVVGSFDHHTHNRLRTRFTDKDTTSVTQCLGYGLDYCLHCLVILCGLLVGHTNILQHLRVDLQRLSQLAHGQFLGKHYFHHFQTGQNTVTSASVLREDDMTTLLTANTAAVLGHVLVS